MHGLSHLSRQLYEIFLFLIWGNRYRKFVTCIGHKIMVKKNAGSLFISLSLYTFVVHFTSSSNNSSYICFWAICKLLWFSQHNFYLFLLCQVLYFHLLNRDWNWGISVIAFWNFRRVFWKLFRQRFARSNIELGQNKFRNFIQGNVCLTPEWSTKALLCNHKANSGI